MQFCCSNLVLSSFWSCGFYANLSVWQKYAGISKFKSFSKSCFHSCRCWILLQCCIEKKKKVNKPIMDLLNICSFVFLKTQFWNDYSTKGPRIKTGKKPFSSFLILQYFMFILIHPAFREQIYNSVKVTSTWNNIWKALEERLLQSFTYRKGNVCSLALRWTWTAILGWIAQISWLLRAS